MFEMYLKKYIDSYLNVDIRPSFDTKVPGICYIHSPISSGSIYESQFEIKVIDDDLDRAVTTRDRIIELLKTPDKESWRKQDELRFRGDLAGGGQLFNDSIQVWELSLIFIIKWRIKNGK